MFVHPELLREMARARMEELRLAAAHSRAAEAPRGWNDLDAIALRLCRVGDEEALARLDALEESTVPSGQLVVAEVDGRIVAALPLAGGAPLRDPFVRTAHLLRLLELRAAQLTREETRRRGLRPWAFGLLRSSLHA